jgi:anti-sigma factor ChrR (cupin superfamily)
VNLRGAAHSSVTQEVEELAALYCVGAMESAEAAEFQTHIQSGCAACLSEVRAFQETVSSLAFSVPEQKPPAGLRARLMDRITSTSQITSPVEHTSMLLRANEGEWMPSGFPGVNVRQLYSEPVTGVVTSLVKMDPGAIYPAHFHFGLEHCYVLQGDVIFHDHTLQTGDYEVAMASTTHSPVSTARGCLLMITNNRRDRILA